MLKDILSDLQYELQSHPENWQYPLLEALSSVPSTMKTDKDWENPFMGYGEDSRAEGDIVSAEAGDEGYARGQGEGEAERTEAFRVAHSEASDVCAAVTISDF